MNNSFRNEGITCKITRIESSMAEHKERMKASRRKDYAFSMLYREVPSTQIYTVENIF
jgi:hypothetical protein